MNRRGFLASLVAIPAGLVAAAKTLAKPARHLWFVDFEDIKIGEEPLLSSWKVNDATGCSLTRACIKPLTPSEIEAMGKSEYPS